MFVLNYLFGGFFGEDAPPEPSKKPVEAKLFPMQLASLHEFPEKSEPKLRSNELVGVACSGGGSRSHTMTAGYLRGLKNLRKEEGIKEFDYLSCVSGGSWAGSIYCFAKLDNEELLGKETDPSKLTMKELKEGNPGRLAATVSTDKFRGLVQTFKNLAEGTAERDLWTEMIKDCILKEFDLHDAIIALDKAHVDDILQRNPHLDDVKFEVVHQDRPFPIINITMLGPDEYNSGYGNSFQVTPLYSGVPYYNNSRQMDFVPIDTWRLLVPGTITSKTEPLSLTIGGGFVETFAVNSPGPVKRKDQFSNFEKDHKQVKLHGIKGDYFYLQDAIGASSAAYAAAFSNTGVMDNLSPMISYFPIFCDKIAQFSRYQPCTKINIGDGGLIDNSGIPPLLQRKVKKVLCFFNSSQPLDLEFKPNRFIEYDFSQGEADITYQCATTDFLGLFGAVELGGIASTYTTITCFRKSDLNLVMQDFVDSVNAGKGAVSRRQLEVLPNSTWNIEGGYVVDICFIYNAHVHEFEKSLPEDTRAEIAKGEDGILENYPYFSTMFQNTALFSLQNEEVSLLSAQAEHTIKENKDLLVDFMGQ
eukprot:snap_masked-scaffold_20-processed-gene-0.29-mRNA-1 protein AED:0.42 eAED:0.42 QI:0/-1/0/1/-1/1/1/0/586